MSDLLGEDIEQDPRSLRGKAGSIPEPRRRPSNLMFEPEDMKGSLFGATFRRYNTVGNLLGMFEDSPFQPDIIAEPGFNPLKVVPEHNLEYSSMYVNARSQAQVDAVTSRIDDLRRDQILIDQHPWKSFGAGVITGIPDPVNWLPGGALFKNYQRASKTARAAAGAAVAGMGSALMAEVVAHQTEQLTNTEESLHNIVAAGILGGALGGGVSSVSRRLKYGRLTKERNAKYSAIENAREDIVDVLSGKQPPLNELGVLPEAELSRIESPLLKKIVSFNPLNRLVNSEFETARRVAPFIFDNNYRPPAGEIAKEVPQSIEFAIRSTMKKGAFAITQAQDAYFEMAGVSRGIGERARAKFAGVEMTLGQFSEAASDVITTQVPHRVEQVNKAAKILEQHIYEPFRQRLVKAGILDENSTVQNAMAYFPIIYNKQKIIESGPRGEPFQRLKNHYTNIAQQIKAFKDSAFYKENRAAKKEASQALTIAKKQLKATTAEMNRARAGLRKRTGIPSSLTSVKVNSDISKLEKQITSSKKLISRNESLISKAKESLSRELTKIETDSKLNVKSLQKEELRLQEKIKLLQKSNQVLEQRHKQLKTPKARQNLELKARKTLSEIEELKGSVSKISNQIKNTKSESIRRSRQLSREAKNQISLFEKQASDTKKSIKVDEAEVRTHRERLNHIEARENVAALEGKRKSILENVENSRKIVDQLESTLEEATHPDWINPNTDKMHHLPNQEMIDSYVDSILDAVKGSTNGITEADTRRSLQALSGKGLSRRTVSIDQMAMKDYHLRDVFKVSEIHVKTMAPILELTEAAQRQGFKTFADMENAIYSGLEKEFKQMAQGKTGKAADKINKSYNSVKSDIKASFDLLKGVYSSNNSTLNPSAANFVRSLKLWNAIRMLGGVVLSSISDIGNIVFSGNGLGRTVYHGFGKSFSHARNMAKRDLKAVHYACETQLGTLSRMFLESEGLSTQQGIFSKTLSAVSDSYGNFSLINYWNDWMQTMMGHTTISVYLDAIHAGEKIKAKDARRLASFGLSKEDINIIREKTQGNVDTTGARYADWTNWKVNTPEEARALKRFQNAIGSEIDNAIIMPSRGDKPLHANDPLISLVYQFKAYAMSMTNKVLINAGQRKGEAEVYTGILSMVALGGLSYVASTLAAGREVPDDPAEFIENAIDRSGVLGVVMEAWNIGKKVGIIPGATSSRYNSRDVMGALFGPSVGTISELAGITSRLSGLTGNELGLGEKEPANFSTQDVEALIKLLPYQNLFYIRKVLRHLLSEGAVSLGAEDRRQ